jgi:glycosyltransferase involved in cell wall biosynthesis
VLRIGIAAMGSAPGRSGGLDVYTRQLVEALAAHGKGCEFVVLVDVELLPVWSDRDWPAHLSFKGLHETEPPGWLAMRGYRHARRRLGLPVPANYGEQFLARQIDALGLDLVHFPRTLVQPFAGATRCVLTFFDLQHEYYPQFFTEQELAFRARTYRPSVDGAAHLIVPSEYTRSTLREKYDVPHDKTSLIPVGISDTFRRGAAAAVEGVRARYQLPREFVFYPANPWQHKNHARLMAALRIYRRRYAESPWLVLSGRLQGERREAMSMAIAAGVEDRVIDLAFVEPSELPALYSAAALMVFPSLFEGFGIPLVEAMACGCPIAAANTTSIPEITDGGALLFDPFDPEQMAEALHQALNDADLRQTLVARGNVQLPRFAWDTIVPQLVAVYERVALQNGPLRRRR